jgi:hypothetical protein
MPQSHKRKPKQKIERRLQNPPRKGLWIVIPGKILGGILAFCTLLGIVVLWPRVSVEVNNSGNNPSVVSFMESNAGYIPLENVTDAMALCYLDFEKMRISGNCAHLGNVRITPPQWKKHRLNIDGKNSLDMRDAFATYGSPMQVTAGDIAIIVTYQPWIVPITMEKQFHFATKVSNDGRTYWAPSAIDTPTAPPQ